MHDNGFIDRADAGQQLAERLQAYRGTDALVLAIPRGGVAVGHALARALRLPLDIVLAKKIGHPDNPEFAIGAVSPTTHHVDPRFGLPEEVVQAEVARLRAQMRDRERHYRGDRPAPVITGRTVIVVDDGVATGHTLLATLSLLRSERPARLIAAMPVVPPDFVPHARTATDDFIHLLAPEGFRAVGQYYADFSAVEDDEVVHLLQDAWRNERT
jgi:predicted phosphoribosyltransferase